MTILEIQDALLADGWQWKENVFNDGTGEAMISLTRDPSPSGCLGSGAVGWGRFKRQTCWEMAYTALIKLQQYGTKENPKLPEEVKRIRREAAEARKKWEGEI